MKFGELAISLGFLSEVDLAQLLGYQTQGSPSLSSILRELGYISEEDLGALFDENPSEIQSRSFASLVNAARSSAAVR
ncbi:MAG: hypothetical protein VYA84_12425 [Planctomycetota bacterium]|nr:hypothetical protein [Planctomycetota bacterium]